MKQEPPSRSPLRPSTAVPVAMVLVLIFAQRFAVPLGTDDALPLTAPLLLALAAVGLVRGALRPEPLLLRLLAVALVTASILSLAHAVWSPSGPGMSLALFALIYLPSCLVATDPRLARSALETMVKAMTALAAVSLALFAAQFAGLAYQDWFALVVPEILIQGGYNTADQLEFGSPIYRSNGIFFLEPSFFGLFLALALIIALFLGSHPICLPVLAAALLTTLSGGGLVFVVVCLPFLLTSSRMRKTMPALGAALGIVIVGLAATTSLVSRALERATEIGSSDSSANLRLIRPYTELIPPWLADRSSTFFGNGLGSADQYLIDNVLDYDLQPAITIPAIPKLAFELGLVGAIAVLVYLVALTLRSRSVAPWSAGLLLTYFVINPSLQQATLAAVTYMFVSMFWSESRTDGGSTALDSEEPAVETGTRARSATPLDPQ